MQGSYDFRVNATAGGEHGPYSDALTLQVPNQSSPKASYEKKTAYVRHVSGMMGYVMANMVMAYIVMAYTTMAYTAMAYKVMAYITMAHITTGQLKVAPPKTSASTGVYNYGQCRYGL